MELKHSMAAMLPIMWGWNDFSLHPLRDRTMFFLYTLTKLILTSKESSLLSYQNWMLSSVAQPSVISLMVQSKVEGRGVVLLRAISPSGSVFLVQQHR